MFFIGTQCRTLFIVINKRNDYPSTRLLTYTYLLKLLSVYLPAKDQTGNSVVNCCALTFTVVTAHCNVWNVYDNEWVHFNLCVDE